MYSYIFTLVQLISYRIRYILLKILLKTNNFKKEFKMNFKALIKKSAQNRIGVARLTKESRMKKRQKYKEFEWVHNFKSISQSTYNIYDETLISFQFIQPSYFMAVLHISNPFCTKKVTVFMS